MNTLFNSAAYWGCFQGTLIFEIYSDYKSMAESSFYSLVSNNCLICAKVALKHFQCSSSLFYLISIKQL